MIKMIFPGHLEAAAYYRRLSQLRKAVEKYQWNYGELETFFPYIYWNIIEDGGWTIK